MGPEMVDQAAEQQVDRPGPAGESTIATSSTQLVIGGINNSLAMVQPGLLRGILNKCLAYQSTNVVEDTNLEHNVKDETDTRAKGLRQTLALKAASPGAFDIEDL